MTGPHECQRCQNTGSVLNWNCTKFIDCPECGGYGIDQKEA